MRSFEEHIKEGTARKTTPDRHRADFLTEEADNSYSFLLEKIEKLGIEEVSANDYVKSCYDILMELIRAKMLIEGYNASGQGAHEAEVSYLHVLGCKEKDVQFTNQLRYFRNGMLYYGTILDKEYAQKVIEFTKKLRLDSGEF